VLGVRSYWDKPLLSYWQILSLSYINGDVSEFMARFPSVVWSVVMLLLTYYDDNRFFANLQSKGYHPQFRKKFRKDEVCVYSNGPSGDGGNPSTIRRETLEQDQ
jgi:hypothetical protein